MVVESGSNRQQTNFLIKTAIFSPQRNVKLRDLFSSRLLPFFYFFLLVSISTTFPLQFTRVLLQLAKLSYLAFEKCHPGLSFILSAFRNCIFFHRVYFFLRNINKSLSGHFEYQCSAIITSREVIIAGYDAIFDQ